MKRVLASLILAATFCWPAAASSPQDKAPDTPGLALRILVPGQTDASFVPVPPTGETTQWIGLFARLPGWKEPEGVLPILAVRFAHRMRGERAFVHVTVHRGVKSYDVEEFVAEYEAAAGDRFVVKELERFGITPFEFEVVRKVEAAAPRAFEAKVLTSSLEAVGAEVDQKNSLVRLTLRNLSPKAVTALKLETRRGGRVLTLKWPLGDEGRPIIEAGGEGVVTIGFSGDSVRKGDGYAPLLPDAVVVSSALFADGSYEGELRAASRAAAQYAGYRVGIARVLELVRRAEFEPGDADGAGAAAKFKESLLAVSRDADDHTVDEVFDAFPSLAGEERESLKREAEAAMGWLMGEVVTQLAPFEAKGAAGDPDFRRWLAAYDKRLSDWLARLAR